MRQLFNVQNTVMKQFEKSDFYQRDVFDGVTEDRVIVGIMGPRGVGKTTYLLYRLSKHLKTGASGLYVSADNLYFLENKLLDLVDTLYKETDVRFLCVDEIHKYSNWKQEIKNIADIYKDFQILFSGSSTIDIMHSKYDLSRRVTLFSLHGLSFREYMSFYQGIVLPKLSFDELVNNHFKVAQDIETLDVLKHFKHYLRVGYYPFFKGFSVEGDKFQAIEHAMQKTIYEDIATMHNLKTPTLLILEKMFKYIVSTKPGELNANKLANALGKDFDSISEYLTFLRDAGLVRFLFSKSAGKAYLRNPTKMYPENTNLIYASYLANTSDEIIGRVRETFVISQFQNVGESIHYSKFGDFSVNDVVFEVGGKNKGDGQIKKSEKAFVLSDGILIGFKNKIPLYLAGLLY